MTFIDGLAEVLGTHADQVGITVTAILAGLGAVGLVAMAGVEMVKALFARALFNAILFARFVDCKCTRVRIHSLAVGGSTFAFYTLKAEALVERLNQIAQDALTYPSELNQCVVFALAKASPHLDPDVVAQMEADWAKLLEKPDLGDMDVMQERDAARERLMQLISSNLTGLEIRLTHIWELMLKLLAIALSVLLIFIVISGNSAFRPNIAIGFAIIGGMIAPVAHDILTVLGSKKPKL